MFPTKRTTVFMILIGIGAIGVNALPITKAGDEKETAKKPDEAARKILLAARQRSANNLRGLMMALWDYHDLNNHFPPAAIYDKNGKELLSWRVLLLPYLDEDDLFAQFHLDEPWDSRHNKPLLAKMPKQYAPPLSGKTKDKNATFYQVFAGKGTIFDGKEGTSLTDILDGTSQTIAIVEAAEAVPWTKPADLPYDAKKPLPKLGGLFDDGFNAALSDGSSQWLKKDFDAATMHLAIQRNDGNPLDFTKLQGKE